ncbi:DUF2303 family protein [Rhodanobacter thiooxydans]|uniref:DUF2303 family protein n=1 Tax=Rhodanobacter thiooxydans TaxID=416169 RepID=UPI000260DA25|nr:DUF2303 family protein [Rhodanobacter thiooxydans]EIL99118.1 prophage protein [Rhodanobacter thiooxydans LCS2]
MDSSAIHSIGQLAIEAAAANRIDANTPAIILTSDDGGQKLISIEHLQEGRSRYRGKFATQNLTAFADYVVSTVDGNAPRTPAASFVDPDNVTATAYFNLGDHEHPGHGDNTAALKLKPTAAYAALLAATNQRTLDQRTLHDFIEDWRDNITVLIDGQPKDNAIAAALAAVRDITVEQARKVQHVERDFGATRSAMESVDARSTLTLPSGFEFKAVPYEGLQERTFRLRLGVNTGGDKLSLTLRIQQAEQLSEDIARDFLARLEARLGTASSLTLGTFTP